jgi:NAD-dependent deacetylase
MSNKKKLVVLTGAGISVESGIKTFRDSDGLWEGHDIMEVASPEGWYKNQDLVLDFYNQRRLQCAKVFPNKAHETLKELENFFEVSIITQNVDDLHERAGSSNIIHLHGELNKAQSTIDPKLIYDWTNKPIQSGDRCERGSQLRPFIVWFGEHVPEIETAQKIVSQADIFAVIGTSLLVYPAAGLIDHASEHIDKYIIDVKIPQVTGIFNLQKIESTASEGTIKLKEILLNKHLY